MDKQTFDELWNRIAVVQQIPEEFHWLLNHVEAMNPETVLEVGVANGGSFRFWLEMMKNKGLAIGVDVCKQTTVLPLIKEIVEAKEIECYYIIGRSDNHIVINKVKRILKKREVDFLFIDAEHTEEAVKKDFENYSPFVRKGGLVGFHDIGLVPDFWGSLKGRKEQLIKTLSTGVWRKDE